MRSFHLSDVFIGRIFGTIKVQAHHESGTYDGVLKNASRQRARTVLGWLGTYKNPQQYGIAIARNDARDTIASFRGFAAARCVSRVLKSADLYGKKAARQVSVEHVQTYGSSSWPNQVDSTCRRPGEVNHTAVNEWPAVVDADLDGFG